MHIIFPNIERAKKSSKTLSSALDGVLLSSAQNSIARISGYRDWHDLEAMNKRGPSSSVSHEYPPETWHQDIAELVLNLSEALKVNWSTALYAISIAHLPGIKFESLGDYEAVWSRLLYLKYDISNKGRTPGSIVKLKIPGRMKNPGILRKSGRPTYMITDRSVDTMVADFEVTIPRTPQESFIPARLKFVYGYWTEESGAQVLFSRDYKPLWRIRDGRKPERLQPWLWIEKVEENHFWEDVGVPWDKKARMAEEEQRLLDFGITALPMLVDVLPELIFDPSLKTVGDAVDVIAKREDPAVTETFQGFLKFT
jgi:hypothetical protein